VGAATSGPILRPDTRGMEIVAECSIQNEPAVEMSTAEMFSADWQPGQSSATFSSLNAPSAVLALVSNRPLVTLSDEGSDWGEGGRRVGGSNYR
jgi:hypothetical protein